MISNHKEFCATSTVDSAAIANALAETDDIKSVIEKVEGAYAFIWYDVEKKRLYFLRNNQRPLYIGETATTWIITSEESLAYWVAKRNNTEITASCIFEEDTPYYIDLDEKVMHKGQRIEKKKKVIPIYTPVTHMPAIIGTRYEQPHYATDCPDEFFLTSEDFKFPIDVMDRLEKGMRILCNAVTYTQLPGSETYKIGLDMINVDKPFMRVIMFMKKDDFKRLDLTAVLEVSVMSVVLQKDIYMVYVAEPNAIEQSTTSSNGTVITEDMWFDDRFPMECDVCTQQITWKDLDQCNVLMQNQTVTVMICPHCSGVSPNVQ